MNHLRQLLEDTPTEPAPTEPGRPCSPCCHAPFRPSRHPKRPGSRLPDWECSACGTACEGYHYAGDETCRRVT